MSSLVGVEGYMNVGLDRPSETTEDDGVEGKELNEEASEDVEERERWGRGLEVGADATLAIAEDDTPADDTSGRLVRWGWKLGGLWKWSRKARLGWKLGSCFGALFRSERLRRGGASLEGMPSS